MGDKHSGNRNSICKDSEPYHTEPEDKLLERVRQEHKGINSQLGGQGEIPRAEGQEWGPEQGSLELQVHVGVQLAYLGGRIRRLCQEKKIGVQSTSHIGLRLVQNGRLCRPPLCKNNGEKEAHI